MSKKGTTSNPHAKEQLRCEVSNTLKGGYCENPGMQRTIDGLLCKAPRGWAALGWSKLLILVQSP
jgi:hypothetical protein